MTHDYQRESAGKEFLLSSVSGACFGAVSVAVGSPFDIVKTKMQAQKGFTNATARETMMRIYRKRGVPGFWRGALPPLVGSSIFRSLQFAGFESAFAVVSQTAMGQRYVFDVCPFTWATVAGGMAGGTLRTGVEIVSENMKIRKQCDERGRFFNPKNFTRGLGLQWVISSVMFTTFVCSLETLRKKTNLAKKGHVGNFFLGGVAGVFCWAVVWPLEVCKSLRIAETEGASTSFFKNLAWVWRERGIKGLFRGFGPGAPGFFLRNGISFIVMAMVNDVMLKAGWRKLKTKIDPKHPPASTTSFAVMD